MTGWQHSMDIPLLFDFHVISVVQTEVELEVNCIVSDDTCDSFRPSRSSSFFFQLQL